MEEEEEEGVDGFSGCRRRCRRRRARTKENINNRVQMRQWGQKEEEEEREKRPLWKPHTATMRARWRLAGWSVCAHARVRLHALYPLVQASRRPCSSTWYNDQRHSFTFLDVLEGPLASCNPSRPVDREYRPTRRY